LVYTLIFVITTLEVKEEDGIILKNKL